MRETPANDGTTPLAIAACQGHIAVVEFLASIGVNAETSNEAGNTPLHLAACEGHLGVVKYLVDVLHAPMYVSNHDGVDPFHAAVDASNGGAVEVVGWMASRPTPPAEAMKRTRLLQRRLRKADDVTDPLKALDPKQAKADEADEARWVAEEEAREARVAKAKMVGAALSDGGGIWSMLSNGAAAKSKRAKAGAATGGGSGMNLLALMGQVEASDVTASTKGPTDGDIAVELRAIEWNNIANGATMSENGVTTAVRGKQLSVDAVYRRLLKARPEWCNANRTDWDNPDLKERVRGLNETSRAAAANRWLRYLSKDARNPDEPWAWVAPSAVFGEVLAGSAGMAVPGPGTALAVVERPAGAISDWATSGGNGQVGASGSGLGVRPQGREAIARSSMAAADAYWDLMHPEEAEAPAIAVGDTGGDKNSRRGEKSKSKPARSSSSSSNSAVGAKWRTAKHLTSVSFANQQHQAAHIAEAATAGAAAGAAGSGADDDGRARLRGRRGAVLASDFTKSWTEGAQAESLVAPESVGDRAKRQSEQAAAAAAEEEKKKRSPRSRLRKQEGDEERKRREAEEEEQNRQQQATAAERADSAAGDRDGVKRYESRVQFIHRVHRDRVEGLGGTTRMMQVASVAKREQAAKEEAKKAKAPGAAAARRRTGVMELARQRKKMLSRDFAAF